MWPQFAGCGHLERLAVAVVGALVARTSCAKRAALRFPVPKRSMARTIGSYSRDTTALRLARDHV